MSRKCRFTIYAVVLGLIVLFLRVATPAKEEKPPLIDTDGPWVGTVKRGSMVREVRGMGKLIRLDHSAKLLARVGIAESEADIVRPNQSVAVDTRKSLVKGRVLEVSPVPLNAQRTVDVAICPPYPPEAHADFEVDATIEIGRLENVIYVGRPVHAGPNSTMGVFRVINDGKEAECVVVKFGRSSVNTIEVLDGLREGDRIILSSTSGCDESDRIHLY